MKACTMNPDIVCNIDKQTRERTQKRVVTGLSSASKKKTDSTFERSSYKFTLKNLLKTIIKVQTTFILAI